MHSSYHHQGLLSQTWINFDPSMDKQLYPLYTVWDEITDPFSHFNSATAEVWVWISNFIIHSIGNVIAYPYWDWINHIRGRSELEHMTWMIYRSCTLYYNTHSALSVINHAICNICHEHKKCVSRIAFHEEWRISAIKMLRNKDISMG